MKAILNDSLLLYLPVDSPNDSSSQTHARDKADMKVFLEDEWLHTGTNEEQSGVEVALPGWGTGVVDKADQKPKQDQVNVRIFFYTRPKLNHQ